jgi:prepilin-type N-terminal cleavage/methylation domain-containing protein
MSRSSYPTNFVRSARRGGFTLLELMISIALVLILILGVNVVFSMTTQTVGAGNALGTIYRANQSFHGVIYQDFRSMVIGPDAPCFVIVNQRRNGWRSAADREADKDGTVFTHDYNGDGDETDAGENIPQWMYNFRNHRIDKLCFFARGKFYRQTGTGTRFWDPDPNNAGRPRSSSEAWIKYGFLALPNNKPNPVPSTDYRPPADTDPTGTPANNTPAGNPNNFYSTQWVLGRQVILLDPNAPAAGAFQDKPSGATATANSADWLRPLTYEAFASDNALLQESRYDVAQTTMQRYREQVRDSQPSQARWRYWHVMGDFYFRGNNMLARPWDANTLPGNAARLLPVFVPGCSQFSVEFAGDFFKQDPVSGHVSGGQPDGEVDWQWEKVADGPSKSDRTRWTKKTRWYGMPRDSNNDGFIYGGADGDDVIPASDFAGGAVPFERDDPQQSFFPNPTPKNWGLPYTMGGSRYIVGWGNDPQTLNEPRPSMLRILLTIDDGRLGGGETFEFVGAVQ